MRKPIDMPGPSSSRTSRKPHPSLALWLVVALLASLPGCGGEAEGGSGPKETANPETTAEPSATSTPGRPGGNTVLGPCEKGFDPKAEPARDCAWVADDFCYGTKVDACECICPRSAQDSFCSSNFYDGPNGRVEVKCF